MHKSRKKLQLDFFSRTHLYKGIVLMRRTGYRTLIRIFHVKNTD